MIVILSVPPGPYPAITDNPLIRYTDLPTRSAGAVRVGREELQVQQIFLATNQEHRRGTRIRTLYAKRPTVTGILISHELGSRKPHRRFFDAALAYVDRSPQQCLFVDDKPAYLRGAAAAGIATLLYRDNAQLVADLTARQLLGPGHSR
jgi:FMN phosphatase YigB (HAD superfamily)